MNVEGEMSLAGNRTAFHKLFLMPKNMKPPEAALGAAFAAAARAGAGVCTYEAIARVPAKRPRAQRRGDGRRWLYTTLRMVQVIVDINTCGR